jgi:hypothetical protein
MSISTIMDVILQHPKAYISDRDLLSFFPGSNQARYDAVSLALKKEWLFKIRRGLYRIAPKFQDSSIQLHPFDLAYAIYQDSYISYESALSFHGWIPERVYTITSATSQRSKEFITLFGLYSFEKVPSAYLYCCVLRYTEGGCVSYLVAQPFKAIADLLYSGKKAWGTLEDLSGDMRIEMEAMLEAKGDLALLAREYPCRKTRLQLCKYLKEVEKYES